MTEEENVVSAVKKENILDIILMDLQFQEMNMASQKFLTYQKHQDAVRIFRKATATRI